MATVPVAVEDGAEDVLVDVVLTVLVLVVLTVLLDVLTVVGAWDVEPLPPGQTNGRGPGMV